MVHSTAFLDSNVALSDQVGQISPEMAPNPTNIAWEMHSTQISPLIFNSESENYLVLLLISK